MNGKVSWKHGLALLTALAVVLVLAAAPAYADVQGITVLGGSSLRSPINIGLTLSDRSDFER